MPKLKGCPLLIQEDTNKSLTMEGVSWKRSYMLECLGEKCAAFKRQDMFCERFQTRVIVPKQEKQNG